MSGTLSIGDHAWALADVALSIEGLWEGSPTWSLTGTVLSSPRPHHFCFGGRVLPSMTTPRTPSDLRDARWSIDVEHRDGEFLGSDVVLKVDDSGSRPVDLLGFGPEIPTLSVTFEGDGARISLRGQAEICRDHESTIETTLSLVTLTNEVTLAPFDAWVGACWPIEEPGPEFTRVQRGWDVFFEASGPAVTYLDYSTFREGNGSGTVVTCPAEAREPDLVLSGMRLVRAHARRFDDDPWPSPSVGIHSRTSPLHRAWMRWRSLLFDAKATPMEAESATQRCAWLRNILMNEMARPKRNPDLQLEIDGHRRVVGPEAHAHPWPLGGEVLEARCIHDEWNDWMLLVRTAEVDALVTWVTGA